MKKFLTVLLALCVGVFSGMAVANTETIHWVVDGVDSTTTCESGGDLILPNPPQKNGYAFIGWASYTPIEYIQSTGTQYIDTGFKPNQNTRVILEYMAFESTNVNIFGARKGYGQDSYAEFYSDYTTKQFTSDYGTSRLQGPVTEASAFLNNKLKIDKNKNVTRVYDVSNSILVDITHSNQTFQTNYNLGIFAYNQTGTFRASTVRIYYVQIYDNDFLVRDMVPILDEDGIPCMYDKVTNTIFYNAGTGTFTAGPAIM